MKLTRFSFESDTEQESRATTRVLRRSTLEKRALAMLGDRAGCVTVEVDGETVISLVRQSEGESPEFEVISA